MFKPVYMQHADHGMHSFHDLQSLEAAKKVGWTPCPTPGAEPEQPARKKPGPKPKPANVFAPSPEA